MATIDLDALPTKEQLARLLELFNKGYKIYIHEGYMDSFVSNMYDRYSLGSSCVKFVWHYSDGMVKVVWLSYRCGGQIAEINEAYLDKDSKIIKTCVLDEWDNAAPHHCTTEVMDYVLMIKNFKRGVLPEWKDNRVKL